MFVPQRRVMMMGDLLNTEIHPGPGESAQVFFSNARNWIVLLDRIIVQRLPVDTYVPATAPCISAAASPTSRSSAAISS